MQHGQQLDGRGARFRVVRRLNHRLAEALQLVRRPRRQIAHVRKEARHVARLQLLPNAIGRRIVADLDAPLVAPHRPALALHLAAELVGAGQPLAAVAVRRHGENESAAVARRAASRVPILVRHGAEPRVLFCQAPQRGVDGLLLGADQPDLHLAAIGKREDLRPQHGRVRDAQQLEPVLAGCAR